MRGAAPAWDRCEMGIQPWCTGLGTDPQGSCSVHRLRQGWALSQGPAQKRRLWSASAPAYGNLYPYARHMPLSLCCNRDSEHHDRGRWKACLIFASCSVSPMRRQKVPRNKHQLLGPSALILLEIILNYKCTKGTLCLFRNSTTHGAIPKEKLCLQAALTA